MELIGDQIYLNTSVLSYYIAIKHLCFKLISIYTKQFLLSKPNKVP